MTTTNTIITTTSAGITEGMTVKVKPSNISSGNRTYRLDIVADSFAVDWGDGVIDSSMEHTYADGDREYTVVVTGANITKLSQGLAPWNNGWSLTALLRMHLPNLSDTDHMFRYAGNIHDWSGLSLPDGVTSIGYDTFLGCSNLESISLPAGLSSIGDYAFYNCGSLASISLPEELTSIGDYAFYNCGSLASISLPEELTSIGNFAFSGCFNLVLTSLPEGLASIGDYAFKGCFNLVLTSLPEGLASIGDYAFKDCTSLANVVFLGTPDSIGENAFRYTSANLFVPWSKGAVANAPWGASGTITYNYVP